MDGRGRSQTRREFMKMKDIAHIVVKRVTDRIIDRIIDKLTNTVIRTATNLTVNCYYHKGSSFLPLRLRYF